MSSATWSEFYPLVLPNVPNCPTITVDQELAAVSLDFFTRTHLWRVSLDDMTTVADQALYDITSPFFDASIESVLWLKVDDKDMTHTDMRLVNPEFLGSTGQPTRFWVENDSSIRLFFVPDKAYSMQGEVALRPKRSARGIPRWVYDVWVDTIVSGVIYKLCRIAGKEWSDAGIAAMHKNLYEQGVTNARIRDMRNVQLRVRMQRF